MSIDTTANIYAWDTDNVPEGKGRFLVPVRLESLMYLVNLIERI